MPSGIGRGSRGAGNPSRGAGRRGQVSRRGNMSIKMIGFGPEGTCEFSSCVYVISNMAGNPYSGFKCNECDVQMVRGK